MAAAASTADAFGGVPLRARLRGAFGRLAGVAVVAAALGLAVALIGFDWHDPSFNQATAQAVRNPVGPVGAYAADLLYQLFGLASWLLVAAGLSWGTRLALGRRLAWPWLPVLSLPLALLGLTAFLATLPMLPPEAWPLRVGLGGAVGDLEWRWLEPSLGARGFAIGSLALALLLGLTALGIRWAEGIWAAGKVAAASLWVGRHLSDAAGAATVRSGRLVRDGWRGMELSRLRRPSEPTPRLADEDGGGEVGRAPKRGLVARLFGGGGGAGEPDEREATLAPRPGRRRLRLGGGDEAPPEPPARRPRPALGPDADEPEAAPSPPERGRSGTLDGATKRKAAHPPPVEPPPCAGEPGFVLPDLDLLAPVRATGEPKQSPQALMETSHQLETVLDDFGVRGEIIDAKTGPVVTLHELEPAPGTRAARVISLADDIARSLCALSVRVAVVPGRNVIGIELPNEKRATVYLRELLEAPAYAASGARLPLALGKDISGVPIIADLARMPHLLIAGTTGSGKSVAINAMILSLLYRLRPEELRVIMIDPKVIELSVYEDIPHLLAPVVTDPPKAVVALKWVVRQMDERYRLMSHLGVRDI
ncbi:MAG TPA: DNA translocase FtsK 4TM domain-containing protein, partial [Geminicoccaceae bacterium]|nr:DNA translocase FtsK 4TM domain-containing protein [Geminicoccaceae bacterium]